MSEQIRFPVLHVHLGPASSRAASRGGALAELMEGLARAGELRQSAVLAGEAGPGTWDPPLESDRVRAVGPAEAGLLPPGLRPGPLRAVYGALADQVADPTGGRRAVQWPAPERWAVVHAHGAAALRAVWLAAAWRGRNPRLVATPLAGDERAPAGLWRKAEAVVAPDAESGGALARRGVEWRRLRTAEAADAAAHLRLYRRLARGERRRVQRVDWSLAGAGSGSARRGSPGRPPEPGSRP